MIRNNRIAFALAVLILLIAAGLRLWNIAILPPGLYEQEILDIRLTENVRQGDIQVLYDLGADTRESLYHMALAFSTGFTGRGSIGYHALSVWFGLVTLSLVYALVKRIYGYTAGLAAMALLAVNFWHILLSRMVGRETVLPLLVAGVMLSLALALPVYWRKRGSRTQTTAFAALGLLLGFGFYVHPVGLVVALFALLYILYMLLAKRVNRQTMSYISFAALVTIIVVTPYLISALRQPQLGGGTRLLTQVAAARFDVLDRVLNALTTLAVTGDNHAIYNLPGRPLFDPFSALLMLIGVVAALRHAKKPRYALPLLATLTLFPLTIIDPRNPSFASYTAMMPVLALFFGLGVVSVARRMRLPGIVTVGLVALLGGNLYWTANDFFVRWVEHPEVQSAYQAPVGQLAHYLDLTAADIPSVVCVDNIALNSAQSQLTPAQLISVMMNRRGGVRFVDCRTGMLLVNGGEPQQIILTPGQSPTVDPAIQRWIDLAQPIEDPSVPQGSVLRLEAASPLADLVGLFTTTTPVQFAPEFVQEGKPDTVAPPVRFGGNLTFLGNDIPVKDVFVPGEIVPVVTYWRVDGLLPSDLLMFVHILNDPGARPPAQHDTISLLPGQLNARDVFVQVTYVELPQSMPEGEYMVSIGAYQAQDSARLVVFDGEEPRGDRLFLYPIRIEQP